MMNTISRIHCAVLNASTGVTAVATRASLQHRAAATSGSSRTSGSMSAERNAGRAAAACRPTRAPAASQRPQVLPAATLARPRVTVEETDAVVAPGKSSEPV